MKPGPKPKGKVLRIWSSPFAYAIGLLTADGCLSKNGRHINFTSTDEELMMLFKNALQIDSKISIKYSGAGNPAYYLQFGDILFYRFLLKIGLTPAKSKTISALQIPRRYFRHFLRGYFDGDGCSVSYFDPIFPKSFRFYISFISASNSFFPWLQFELEQKVGVRGCITVTKRKHFQLKFSKAEALKLVQYMYVSAGNVRLSRKYLKIMESVRIIRAGRSGETGRRTVFRTQRGQPHEGSTPSFGTT